MKKVRLSYDSKQFRKGIQQFSEGGQLGFKPGIKKTESENISKILLYMFYE